MKHGWVTALSVAGVIGAGAAAVVANSTVFASASGDDTSVMPLEQVVQEAAVSPVVTVVYDTSVAPTAAPTSTTGASTTLVSEAGTDTTQAYEVGRAGLVELRHDASTITVVTAIGNPGWRVVSSSPPGSSVQVVFAGGDQQVRFTATLVGGQVAVTVEATDTRPPTSARPTPSTSTVQREDDREAADDREDEAEDEDHEDEEDEEHEGRDEDD